MNEQYAGSQEQLLTSLSIAAHDVSLAAERLEFLTRQRRRLAEELMSSSDLPLAELARVAGVHRHTMKAWQHAMEVDNSPDDFGGKTSYQFPLTLSSGLIQDSSPRGIDQKE